ncbi:MAG: hypothetical protein KVP17_003519 [Porospora cf. gigantea B]|uniref:uncharacterized protein n=1 Tax=Porospora cf. gigantea B TaxID=2853592 RepID=UPI003571F537|nr:MAG: hypothetical protein KVP17_003519 [Porospora cf. gigantea B]
MDDVMNVQKWIDEGLSGDSIADSEGSSNWHFSPRDPTKDLQYVLRRNLPLLKPLFEHLSASRDMLTPTTVAELCDVIATIVTSAISWLEKNDPGLLEALRAGPTLDYALWQLERAIPDASLQPLVDALRAETGVNKRRLRTMQGSTRKRKPRRVFKFLF